MERIIILMQDYFIQQTMCYDCYPTTFVGIAVLVSFILGGFLVYSAMKRWD